MTDGELDTLARHLGHDAQTHRDNYRLSHATRELTVVSVNSIKKVVFLLKLWKRKWQNRLLFSILYHIKSFNSATLNNFIIDLIHLAISVAFLNSIDASGLGTGMSRGPWFYLRCRFEQSLQYFDPRFCSRLFTILSWVIREIFQSLAVLTKEFSGYYILISPLRLTRPVYD